MKRVLIVLLLIVILAFLITSCLIINKRTLQTSLRQIHEQTSMPSLTEQVDIASNNIEEKQLLYKTYHENIKDGISNMISETYDENPIKIEKLKYEDDLIIGDYIIISGLKDKEIENKINEAIKSEFINATRSYYDELYEYYFVKNAQYPSGRDGLFEGKKLIGKQVVLANFSNIISIKTYINTLNLSQCAYINFNLNNGNELKFEELFTSDFNILESVMEMCKGSCSTHYFYDDLVEEGIIKERNFTEAEKAWGIYYTSIDEVKLQRMVNAFKYNDKIKFWILPDKVNYILLDHMFEISFDRNNCAIYDRFLDKSIFENLNLGYKNISCFNNVSVGNYIKYAKNEVDNDVRYDYYIMSAFEDDKTDEIKNFIIDKFNSHTNTLKSKLEDNQKLIATGVFGIYKYYPRFNYAKDSESSDYVDRANHVYYITYNPRFIISKNDDELFSKKNIVSNVFLYDGDYLDLHAFDSYTINMDASELDFIKKDPQILNSYQYGLFLFDKDLNILKTAEDIFSYVTIIDGDLDSKVRKMYAKMYENSDWIRENYNQDIENTELNMNHIFLDISVKVRQKQYDYESDVSLIDFATSTNLDDSLSEYIQHW